MKRVLIPIDGSEYSVRAVAQTISTLANSLQCDQIMMGTHGRGALSDFLMGAITLKVIHLTTMPVLLVK